VSINITEMFGHFLTIHVHAQKQMMMR